MRVLLAVAGSKQRPQAANSLVSMLVINVVSKEVKDLGGAFSFHEVLVLLFLDSTVIEDDHLLLVVDGGDNLVLPLFSSVLGGDLSCSNQIYLCVGEEVEV